MNAVVGVALCALLSTAVFGIKLGVIEGKANSLAKDIELLRNYIKAQENNVDSLTRHVDQNAYNIRRLSESCSQVEDLGIEIKVCQERVNHTMDMIEELKAKRSMDILDKLREEGNE